MNTINNAILTFILLSSYSNFCSNTTSDGHATDDQAEKIFTNIYTTKLWKLEESFSGVGSEVRFTERTRRGLTELIKLFKITSIADAPCGDFNWMKLMNLGTCKYIGIDIVQELIERNKQLFGPAKEFKHLNLIEDIVDKVDLIICRDMLAHLTYEQIFKVLKNFKDSGSKYLLVTTGLTTSSNTNITTGEWRSLNLELPPFNFPKPVALIAEDAPFTFEQGKHLGLWRLQDINA